MDVEGRGQRPKRPGSLYEKFLKASRSKAMSSRRCSSVMWVFLLPVAGAAAGSRPAYLRVTGGGDFGGGRRGSLRAPRAPAAVGGAYHTGLARLMVVRSRGFT